MTENNVQEWDKEVERASEHAQDVYNLEVDLLGRDFKRMNEKDVKEFQHVKREVELDAYFAVHHLEYLKKVVARELKHLERALDRVARAEASGNEKHVERAKNHVDEVIADGAEHIKKVALHVEKSLERDAKAAAKHVMKGLEEMELNADDVEEEIAKASNRVAEELQKVVEAVSNED